MNSDTSLLPEKSPLRGKQNSSAFIKNSGNTKKIVVLVNAHAMAHVSRPLEIAKVLRKQGHEIIFAGFGKYLEIAGREDFEIVELPYITSDHVAKAVKAQRLDKLFKAEQLSVFIEAELKLYKKINPDLILIDNRMTAFTSAELAGIKTVSILNVHMSRYRKVPFFSLRNILGIKENKQETNLFIKLADWIENKLEFFFYDRLVMSDMNKLRKKYGLKKKYGFSIEEGDLTLFPDLPHFNPVQEMPANAHYIGPLTWHTNMPAPLCIREKKLDPSKKTIYLTIGSDGLEELLAEINSLANNDVQIIIALGRKIKASDITVPSNVFIEEFVNTDELYATTPSGKCMVDLVVCHGGNGTIYQALAAGIPIVGISTHEEQNYGLNRLNRLELGIGITEKALKQKGLQLLIDKLDKVLNEPKYKENALKFKQTLLPCSNGNEKAATLIEDFMKHPQIRALYFSRTTTVNTFSVYFFGRSFLRMISIKGLFSIFLSLSGYKNKLN